MAEEAPKGKKPDDDDGTKTKSDPRGDNGEGSLSEKPSDGAKNRRETRSLPEVWAKPNKPRCYTRCFTASVGPTWAK